MRTVMLVIAIAAFPAIAFSQKNFVDQNYIEVTGRATIKLVPDLIYLRIQISEQQKNKSDLERKERDMLTSLKNIGIDVAKDLVVKDLASNLQLKVFAKDNIVISKVYVLVLHDAKTANRVITDLNTLEISNIRIDHLDHTRMADYRKECGVKAIIAAQAKAETLTQSIGQSVGRAIYVEEQTATRELDLYGQNMVSKAKADLSERWLLTDLDFDEIPIDYAIMVRFELK